MLLPSPLYLTSRPSRQLRYRRAFTLIEMLIVLTIVVILISLVASGMFAVFKSADKARISTEISQLAGAVKAFTTQYQVPYLPSSIVLDETATSGGATNNTDPFIQRMWPRINYGPGIDWNGDGTISGTYTLQGQQCLVFFLGGINGYLGFSTNPTNPAAPVGGDRVGPFYNFPTSRLSVTYGAAGFPCFLDPIGKPYAYFNAPKLNTYTSDCGLLSGLGLTGPYINGTLYYNQQSFQIISAGSDGLFGPGGQWDSTNPQANASYKPGAPGFDDMTNFHSGGMGTNN